MRTSYYLNGKRISKKDLVSLITKHEVDLLTTDAKRLFMCEPNIELSYRTIAGVVTVVFNL